MTLILTLLGWLIVSSLWGFLPVIAPVRQFAAINPLRRKWVAAICGFLSFVTGTSLLYWIICYGMVGFFSYYAHGDSPLIKGLTETQVSSNLISITNQVMLRTTVLGDTCLMSTPAICEISKRVIQNGFNPSGMLPIAAGISLIPALIAALINKKLTAAPQQTKSDML